MRKHYNGINLDCLGIWQEIGSKKKERKEKMERERASNVPVQNPGPSRVQHQ
jgi:hypothetical protein